MLKSIYIYLFLGGGKEDSYLLNSSCFPHLSNKPKQTRSPLCSLTCKMMEFLLAVPVYPPLLSELIPTYMTTLQSVVLFHDYFLSPNFLQYFCHSWVDQWRTLMQTMLILATGDWYNLNQCIPFQFFFFLI